MRVRNFCAGPAAIPEPVLEEVRSELLEWGNAGMSIMEMSHRSSIFNEVASNAKQDFIELLKIPDEYDVLFLQGGATHQFSMVPLNFSSLPVVWTNFVSSVSYTHLTLPTIYSV